MLRSEVEDVLIIHGVRPHLYRLFLRYEPHSKLFSHTRHC